MKNHVAVLVILAFLALGAAAGASTSPVFDKIIKSYEEVRLALVEDSLDGIDTRAAAIRAAAAGSEEATKEDVRPLLPKIAGFADELARAPDLDSARTAFYELSKMLVQFRAKVEGERPVVVYCAMAKRSWLQPEGEIGNPYYGQTMGACGEIVEW